MTNLANGRFDHAKLRLRFALSCLILLVAVAFTTPSFGAAPPSIVLILADDLGWTDLGCYGADLHGTHGFRREHRRRAAQIARMWTILPGDKYSVRFRLN